MLTAYCEIRKNILAASTKNAAASKRKTGREAIRGRSDTSVTVGEIALGCTVAFGAFPQCVENISDSFDRSRQTLFGVADNPLLRGPNDRRRDCRRRPCRPGCSCL